MIRIFAAIERAANTLGRPIELAVKRVARPLGRATDWVETGDTSMSMGVRLSLSILLPLMIVAAVIGLWLVGAYNSVKDYTPKDKSPAPSIEEACGPRDTNDPAWRTCANDVSDLINEGYEMGLWE